MDRRTEILLFRWLRPHHAIIFLEFCAFTALIASYGIAVGTGKLPPVWPYISSTAAIPPASCIFTMLFSLAAVLASAVIYIRHLQLEEMCNEHSFGRRFHSVNDVSMFLGQLLCLGALLVGCFQWNIVFSVHMIGAFLVFVSGNVYCCLQTWLSYKCLRISSGTGKVWVQFVLNGVAVLGFILTIAFFLPEERRIVSTFSEWVMCVAFLLYFITYYQDFKKPLPRRMITNSLE